MIKKIDVKKITILSISLMISSASAISVTLPMIKNEFPEIKPSTVESLVTVPSFTMLVFILLSTFIIKKIGKKNTVLVGLIIALIGGTIPAFTTNFSIIYLSRLLLGAGTGIYNSLAISLIGEYFHGDEQKEMLGYQQAFSALGTSLATFIAGVLVNLSWQSAYSVYFLILPIMILVYLFLPKDEKIKLNESHIKEEKKEVKPKINFIMIFSCFMMFIFFSLIMVIYTKTSTLIVEKNYENQSFLGTSLTVASLIGSLIGFFYSYIRNFFKKLTPVFSLFFIAISYFVISFTNNMIYLTIVLIFTFLVVGLFVPYMYDILLPNVPEGATNLSVSLAMVSCNLGAFSSPYIINSLGTLFNDTSASFSYVISGVIYLLMALMFIFFNMFYAKDIK